MADENPNETLPAWAILREIPNGRGVQVCLLEDEHHEHPIGAPWRTRAHAAAFARSVDMTIRGTEPIRASDGPEHPLVDAACEKCGAEDCPGRDYPDRCKGELAFHWIIDGFGFVREHTNGSPTIAIYNLQIRGEGDDPDGGYLGHVYERTIHTLGHAIRDHEDEKARALAPGLPPLFHELEPRFCAASSAPIDWGSFTAEATVPVCPNVALGGHHGIGMPPRPCPLQPSQLCRCCEGCTQVCRQRLEGHAP